MRANGVRLCSLRIFSDTISIAEEASAFCDEIAAVMSCPSIMGLSDAIFSNDVSALGVSSV